MNNCLDIGIIQAFLDGELPFEETARVSSHIAACDNCSVLLADAEEESASVFPVLAREIDTLVPTQRLWNKINDSIVVEHDNRPLWTRIGAFFIASLGSPSMLAAASIILVFGIFTALWINKNNAPGSSGQDARVSVQQPITIDRPSQGGLVNIPSIAADPVDSRPAARPDAPRIERAAYRPENGRARATALPVPNSSSSEAYLPAEESYVRTISTLSKTVDQQKDNVLRPSERVAFERDMAVVDDAIAKMKVAVKHDPKNEPAKQVLYSSYQNKIDLLNSVAQKEELVASLR